MEVPVDAELATLASSGAKTLIGLMVSDGWAQTRARVAKLIGRRSAEHAEAIAAELESAQVQLIGARGGADESLVADLEAEWRSRFRRLLESDPQAVTELRRFLNEVSLEEDHLKTSIRDINMNAKAADQGRVYQVGSGEMHIGDA